MIKSFQQIKKGIFLSDWRRLGISPKAKHSLIILDVFLNIKPF